MQLRFLSDHIMAVDSFFTITQYYGKVYWTEIKNRTPFW